MAAAKFHWMTPEEYSAYSGCQLFGDSSIPKKWGSAGRPFVDIYRDWLKWGGVGTQNMDQPCWREPGAPTTGQILERMFQNMTTDIVYGSTFLQILTRVCWGYEPPGDQLEGAYHKIDSTSLRRCCWRKHYHEVPPYARAADGKRHGERHY